MVNTSWMQQRLKMIFHDSKEYQDADLIDWEIAIAEVGFYFERAKYLGLPCPPACFVFDNSNPTDEQLKIIGKYHELYNAAELCDISNEDVFKQLPKASLN